MVTTAGSKTEIRRVTIVWIAETISQATGIGSIESWGIEAWPPAPLTMIERTRSEEHTSELQSLMRISYAVFCLKKKTKTTKNETITKNKTQTERNYIVTNHTEYEYYSRRLHTMTN